MNNYQNVLVETNLSENQLTKKMQTNVMEHKLAIAELLQLKSDLSDIDENDEKYEELNEEIEELEEALMESDNQLCEAIAKYAAQKPSMDEKIKRMQDGRARKIAEAQGNPPAPAAPPAPAPPAPIVAAQAQNNPAPTTPTKEKETSFGTWLFWGALGIAGFFIGARISKNR